MTRNSASRETIDVLIDNAKSTMSYSEQLLQNAELIKSKFSEHHITHYLQLLFELLSGSLSAIYEVCSDIKNMLSTENVYTKRFHLQMINLSQYELSVYLVGRDQGGVISELITYLNKSHQDSKELEDILQQVKLLGEQCDIRLRNVTAHYDNPNTMYTMLTTLNDEDVYAKRFGNQLLIHDKILKFISSVLQVITEKLSPDKKNCTYKKSVEELTLVDILNDRVAEAFHNKGELDIIITEQMANAWVNIESHKKIFSICENAIGYLKDKQFDYSRLTEIRTLEELRWEVSFMHYDLVCSMDTYLKASSNAERSISFMRTYRIETSALSHLYGYNEKYKVKSIWNKIKSVPEFKYIPLSIEIEDELKALTAGFNSTK